MHVIDLGLVAAFKAYPGRDLGHKLETAVFLHQRRRRKDLFYYANGHEVEQAQLGAEPAWRFLLGDSVQA
ncbi:MAG: hypothetical protein WAW39_28670 [Prosthecobacter sp.]|uniref:hypothetical protein n=1 Tax=Prosthecobacter sp. TaxID=1965333 RepID=UPI003BAEE890